ncbi:PrpR N-terminal domain-containing protein [Lachnospira pectinoschiza]|uniref:Transcriptional regulator containing PAS, AAA-type ATPase, and DNA-binding Fis domains n=1 Tax=Lachnospira pectinoschiza TaxID=28052 RepID=A0A1G9T252_9FIRM|nr:PrpR N-terminal domain-containing protein [Lachnospira pectinoschiza]SDM41687.1 Transcriptional regulator containing PAS, AAA-type ATPase, and DNA-binding Fis domains [Lachnospira pectinoschiza]
MSNIAVLFPEEEMLDIVSEMDAEVQEDIIYKKAIQTVNAISEARKAINEGADIIVARGYQHLLIDKYTNIPTVAVKFQAQEVGILVKKAKTMIKDKKPCIGFIAFPNTLGNLDMMAELFDVEFHVETITQIEECTLALKELAKYNVDLIIGGKVICEEAQKMGLLTLLYKTTYESIYTAIEEARRISKAIEIEKQNVAQFTTVIDHSFSGIIKINKNHKIIAINERAQTLIKTGIEDAVGQELFETFPDIEKTSVDKVLTGERESYTTSVNIKNQSWIILIAPIQYDEKITGAIISLQKLERNSKGDANKHLELMKNGFIAQRTFKDIITNDEGMKEQIRIAKVYALSSNPILIYSEVGNQAESFAEAIHNNSDRKAGSFVSIDVEGLTDEQQVEVLFGDLNGGDITKRTESALAKASHGTLFIRNIDKLSKLAQSQLLRTLMFRKTLSTDMLSMDEYDVRIIALSREQLLKCVERGCFNKELFYYLHGLTLNIPSLEERPKDLEEFFDSYIKEFSRKYSKFVKISIDAKIRLKKLEWPGNLIQLRTFAEKLVIVTNKRIVDDRSITKTYQELYPDILKHDDENILVVYKEHEAKHLEDLMMKYNGNRKKIAAELGISTTTLWRKLKKYAIE